MSGGVQPDLLITGALVHTFGKSDGRPNDALLIGDGRVLMVGAADELARFGDGCARLRLDGGSIMPGFCDTHMHLEKIAAELSMVDLAGADSIASVLQRVRAYIETAQVTWCQSFGDDNAWHESQLAERRLPTRLELDSVAPTHPVFLYRGPDVAILNSVAVAALGGRLEALDGWEPTSGLLHSPAAKELQTTIPGDDDPIRQLARAADTLLGYGITTIVDPGLPGRFAESWALYGRARKWGALPIRTWLMDRLDHRLPFEDELDRAAQESPTPYEGDDRLHGFGLKLIVDGEFDNAWMRAGEPQRAAPAQRYTVEELRAVLRLCHAHGWPATFHVMGGGAIAAVLSAVGEERLSGREFVPGQLTCAHLFHPDEEDLRALRAFGLSVSVQPLLAYVFAAEMSAAWADLAERANPFKSMLESGVDVSGGSDVLPCEPLRGAAYAVARRSRCGRVLGAAESIRPQDALALFTSAAGPFLRAPGHGRLEPGSPADFAWWPNDPVACEPETWPALSPGLVAVAGETVWQRDNTIFPTAATRRAYT